MKWRIPLSDVNLDEREEEAVLRVVRSGWLTAGEEVAAFEREFARFIGVEDAVAVASCTAALHLACVALAGTATGEVIVPSLTFVATASAVVHAGDRPAFADSVGEDDLTLDPDDVERRITPHTKGIVCVHYAGYPCQMDRLLDLCRRYGLFLIEDVAHAPGAMWGGRMLGTLGDVGCFSFFGNKNMTTGEGGMVLARDPAVLARVRSLRSHGMTTSTWDRYRGHAHDYDVLEPGFNYRLAEMPAAMGREQLRKLSDTNRRRRELLERYRRQLADVAGIWLPFARREDGVAHLAVAMVADPAQRDKLRAVLTAAGIQSSLHYPPIHLFDHFRSSLGHNPGDLPVVEDAASRILTLPLYPTMAPELVDEVCQCVAAFV